MTIPKFSMAGKALFFVLALNLLLAGVLKPQADLWNFT